MKISEFVAAKWARTVEHGRNIFVSNRIELHGPMLIIIGMKLDPMNGSGQGEFNNFIYFFRSADSPTLFFCRHALNCEFYGRHIEFRCIAIRNTPLPSLSTSRMSGDECGVRWRCGSNHDNDNDNIELMQESAIEWVSARLSVDMYHDHVSWL